MYDQAAHDRRNARLLADFERIRGTGGTFQAPARIVAPTIPLSPFVRRALARELPGKVVGS